MMLINKVFYICMTLLGFSNPTEKRDKQIISNHKFFLHFEQYVLSPNVFIHFKELMKIWFTRKQHHHRSHEFL